MFKKISVFLVLVLVIGALSACAGSEGSNAELTEEKKEAIARAWGKKCYPIDWNATSGQPGALRYYGTFAGHDVFRLLTPDVSEDYLGTLHIDGVPFYGYFHAIMGTCRNGVYTALGELYKNFGINRDTLLEISKAHDQGVSLNISRSKRKEIEDAWYGSFGSEWKWVSDPEGKSFGCRYYGKYNGYDIIFYQGSEVLAAVHTSFEIAGEKFSCGYPFVLYGYRNGQIYDLEKLYEDGKVSAKSLTAMAETHKSWFRSE